MKSQLALTAAAAIWMAIGCGGDDDDDGANSPVDASTQAEVRCPADIPAFYAGETSGMEAMGENEEIKARLIAADRVPPARFANTWTVELMDAQGTPLADAEIVKACAFMTVHRHGLPPRMIEPLDEPGRFELQALNFSMRGPWQVQLAVRSDSVPEATARGTDCAPNATGTDYLAFDICVKDE